MAVPFFDHVGERKELEEWAAKRGEEGIRDYWQRSNRISIDGRPTNIMEKNSGAAAVRGARRTGAAISESFGSKVVSIVKSLLGR